MKRKDELAVDTSCVENYQSRLHWMERLDTYSGTEEAREPAESTPLDLLPIDLVHSL
jgi:hypothetical protein